MIELSDNLTLYEQKAIWGTNYLKDPYYRLKVGLVREMILIEISTILDVGWE